jgi:hypothetical protein
MASNEAVAVETWLHPGICKQHVTMLPLYGRPSQHVAALHVDARRHVSAFIFTPIPSWRLHQTSYTNSGPPLRNDRHPAPSIDRLLSRHPLEGFRKSQDSNPSHPEPPTQLKLSDPSTLQTSWPPRATPPILHNPAAPPAFPIA